MLQMVPGLMHFQLGDSTNREGAAMRMNAEHLSGLSPLPYACSPQHYLQERASTN